MTTTGAEAQLTNADWRARVLQARTAREDLLPKCVWALRKGEHEAVSCAVSFAEGCPAEARDQAFVVASAYVRRERVRMSPTNARLPVPNSKSVLGSGTAAGVENRYSRW
jgi:hypothetical protein